MNKAQLIDAVAARQDTTKAAAARSIDAVLQCIREGIDRAGSVTISGFGTFTKKQRPARTGRNPATGRIIEIKASRTVNFKPSQLLKDALR